jgi:daunorubicin/doxorubicin transport system ATP-binding protein
VRVRCTCVCWTPSNGRRLSGCSRAIWGPCSWSPTPPRSRFSAEADRGAEAIAGLTRAGVRIADFSLGQPSLDEVFLALTGHPAEEEPSAKTDTIEEEQPA